MSDLSESEVQRRKIQRARNIVVGVLLAAFVVLIFAISIVKMD